eukprot:653074-Pleurochrysis_carterae.AAC.2
MRRERPELVEQLRHGLLRESSRGPAHRDGDAVEPADQLVVGERLQQLGSVRRAEFGHGVDLALAYLEEQQRRVGGQHRLECDRAGSDWRVVRRELGQRRRGEQHDLDARVGEQLVEKPDELRLGLLDRRLAPVEDEQAAAVVRHQLAQLARRAGGHVERVTNGPHDLSQRDARVREASAPRASCKRRWSWERQVYGE